MRLINSPHIYLVLLVIFVPGLRAFYKYSTHPLSFFILYVAICTTTLYTLSKNIQHPITRIVCNKKFIISAFFIAFCYCIYIYPIADGLKATLRGSDQDDCIIIGASNLLNGLNPYQDRSYFGNPCSPGFGVIFLYLPFVYFNLFSIAGITYILIASLFLRWSRGGSNEILVTFLVALISCIATPELLATGSDLITIGSSLVILSIVTQKAITEKKIILTIASAILCGLVASARINLLAIIPSLSLLFWFSFRKNFLLFLLVSFIVACLPSTLLLSFFPDVYFTPFHLINKSAALLSPAVIIFGGLASILIVLEIAKRCAKIKHPVTTMLFFSLLPMLTLTSLGDLYVRNFDLSSWEGANYLIPLVFLGALILTQSTATKT